MADNDIKLKKDIADAIENIKESLWEISDFMYANPELSDEEFISSEKLANLLRDHGFSVEFNIANRATAFKGVFDSGKPGPTVAFLCEYDALPGIGHGCGHNMIGTMGAGAGVALSKVLESTGGKVYVFGTCAEEVDGAKVDMAAQGVFSDVDVAIMVHPQGTTMSSGGSLAMQEVKFVFHGKSSHAAVSPELGINALDACIFLFNGVNALREHVTPDVRMHGIITEGGLAPNIVPELAKAEFYVRARKSKTMYETVERVRKIAEGAALMAGATVEVHPIPGEFEDMNTNRTLSDVFDENLRNLGITDIIGGQDLLGSLDMGNVSYVTPSIHAFIGLDDPTLALHTQRMADATITPLGHERILVAATAMAQTGYDVLTNPELLEKIKAEFKASI